MPVLPFSATTAPHLARPNDSRYISPTIDLSTFNI